MSSATAAAVGRDSSCSSPVKRQLGRSVRALAVVIVGSALVPAAAPAQGAPDLSAGILARELQLSPAELGDGSLAELGYGDPSEQMVVIEPPVPAPTRALGLKTGLGSLARSSATAVASNSLRSSLGAHRDSERGRTRDGSCNAQTIDPL